MVETAIKVVAVIILGRIVGHILVAILDHFHVFRRFDNGADV